MKLYNSENKINWYPLLMESKQISNSEFGWFISFVLVIFSKFSSEKIFWSQTFFTLALVVAVVTALDLKILTSLNLIWHQLGKILGYVSNPLFLGILYFALVTPIAIMLKILKRDELGLKWHDSKSYWEERKYNEFNFEFFKRQF